MRAPAIAFALGALVTGLTAAWHWYQSSKITPDPGWTGPSLPGPSEPVIPELRLEAWTSAMLTALGNAGAMNGKAARWTAVSVVLSTVSAVVGALAPN